MRSVKRDLESPIFSWNDLVNRTVALRLTDVSSGEMRENLPFACVIRNLLQAPAGPVEIGSYRGESGAAD